MPTLSCRATLGCILAVACFVAGAAVASASSLQTIYQFDPGKDGSSADNLIAAPDGRLFGTLDAPDGTFEVFELDPPAAAGTRWTERPIFKFPQHYGKAYGHNLLLAANGHLFATASAGYPYKSLVLELLPPASGGTQWTAVVRASTPKAGGIPIGGISLFYVDSSNVLYGSGYETGSSTMGVIIRLAPSSTDPTQYRASVLSPSCASGEPDDCGLITGLVKSSDGSFYGSDFYVLFQLTPPAAPGGAWTRQTFPCVPQSACGFYTSLRVVDRSQNLFVRSDATPGSSAVVKVARPWSAGTTLANFSDGAGFGSDVTSLVEDSTGLLFATTEPTASTSPNFGTIVSFWSGTPTKPKVLHAFSGPDGSVPTGLVSVLRSDGLQAFFGLTLFGGKGGQANNMSSGAGTVFQLVP